MIIDVTEVGEDEEDLGGYVGYRKPYIEEGAVDTTLNGFDKKMLLASLCVVLLFVGGGIYAWQGSQLKTSLGGAVQDVPLVKAPLAQPQAQDEANSLAPTPAPVSRNTIAVTRTQAAKVEVVSPNGGETFCSGQSFRITWRYARLEQVRVFLQTENGQRYDLGVAPAAGGSFPDLVQVPSAQGAVYRVVAADATDNSVFDASNAPFSIVNCSIATEQLQ